MSRPAHTHRPPMIEGVSASCVALPHEPWPRLIDFLSARLPAVSASQWAARMTAGRVLDDQGHTLPPEAPYTPGRRVYYYRELDDEPTSKLQASIVFQDAHLLVADKPHFMPVTPTGRYVRRSLLVQLKQQTSIETLTPIHRIDRETAGLVIFSVRPQDRDAYQRLFRDQRVEKVYEAIAPMRTTPPLPSVYRSRIVEDERFFRQREVPGEPNSKTALEITEVRDAWAKYLLRPRSGRTHQLRVHMNALERPIAGDLFYPEVLRGPQAQDDELASPLRLLARSVAFDDPITHTPRFFRSAQELSWP